MLVRLTKGDDCHDLQLSYARIKYLDHTPTWKVKAAIIQQKRPVINGWRIEVIEGETHRIR